MKIIDLLNKIANGEEVPKHINIRDLDKYTWQDDVKAYWSDRDENNLLSDLDLSSADLNEDIEILEEEKKIPEKLEKFDIQGLEVSGYSMTQAEYLLEDGVKENREMINWILDYLKSKGDE